MALLAGGVAFNVLLAGVPFLLLLASLAGYLLGTSADTSAQLLERVFDRLLPLHGGVESSILEPVVGDIVRTRAAFGISGAVGFLLFSARLFGSLRSVMKRVFEHAQDRSFLVGVLWDIQLSVTSAVLFTAWVALSAWLAVSRGRIGDALTDLGALSNVLSGVEYLLGRLLAVAVLAAAFAALYRWLPKVRTSWPAAVAGGAAAALLFEFARVIFGVVVRAFPPSSVFTGTLGALVVVVFWAYYAALIFVVGAETASATSQALAPPMRR